MNLSAFENWSVASNHVNMEYAEGQARIVVCTPEIVRVRVAPQGEPFADDGPVVVKKRWPGIPFSTEDQGDRIQVRTAWLRVELGKKPFRMSVFDVEGHALHADEGSGVTWEPEGVGMVRRMEPEEQFFGFGLQFHRFGQRGAGRFLKTTADASEDNGQAQVVVPFFISTRGYGVFLNSFHYTTFDMGATSPDAYAFRTPGTQLDVYFIYGPTPREIVSRYTRIVGRMDLPPKWGLGFWYRMRSVEPAWPSDKVQAVAEEFRRRGVPCDVVGLEPNWQTHAYSCSYVWNRKDFPDPPGFVRAMKAKGFHLNLWEHAYVHPSSPIHDELDREGCGADRRVWEGIIPDFTLPKARTIFKRFHRAEHVDLGVDGYKLDECDGSDFTGGWFFPDETRFPGGMTGAEMHNLFGFLYQQTMHDLFDEVGRRTYFLCRGNFAGAQRYASCAYSDYYGFREYVRALVNSGFTGVLWCPEVRQTSSDEEFVRRSQVVFFSPLSMINAWADGVTPWEKGEEVERIFRIYAELRMRLIPYLYSAWWNMRKTGISFIRPLVMDYPDDPLTFGVDDEYFFGDAFLVAPVLEGTERSIYLPRGPWTDFWTGDLYQGAQTLQYAAPLERLPLFVKEGAMVPMAPVMNYAGEHPVEEIEMTVYPSEEWTTCTLYEDDGETLAYRKGQYATVRFACVREKGRVTVRMDKPHGSYAWSVRSVLFTIHGCSHRPSHIQVHGKVFPRLDGEAEGTMGWWFDEDRGIVGVRVAFGKTLTLAIYS